ncbi:MAG: DUF4255 domain-containing protein [Flavobacteriia bacterium]|nr:DUF4255 domain-containing protein [Flavobacteriia bacterium]OJX37508.1 MAG: hypothetical protein BGO87_00675 [Flavobacteriia bacterium 40-80]
MIYEVLQILVTELNIYFQQQIPNVPDDIVVLDNIALADSESETANNMKNKVVVSLLTIDEESTLRNFPNQSRVNNQTEYYNPEVNLNLYVLFSANANEYKESLLYLSKTIEFFQSKNVFTQNNSSYPDNLFIYNPTDYFKFSMELYTPNFEDLNYIWGTLGGRQFPSALYKLALVTIAGNRTVNTATTINETGSNMTPNF